MKKKINSILPFVLMPVLIPIYRILDTFILVEIFGCGCVPSTQTNMLNIPFNANDLRLTVFSALTIAISVWSIVISKGFSRKSSKILYCSGVFIFNVMLAAWAVKAFMWA